jgi:hypothetical protein
MDNLPLTDFQARCMLSYQKQQNIKGMCVINCKYLLECLQIQYPKCNAKVLPVIVVEDRIDNLTEFCIVHMVIVIDEKDIIDPSYEVYSLKNIRYENINFINNWQISKKKEMSENCNFMQKTANLINNGLGNTLFDNKEYVLKTLPYYNKQADFTEECARLRKNCNIEKLNSKLSGEDT